MAKSESQRLDSADHLQILEEKLKSHQDRETSEGQGDGDLSETIHAKDQIILKLEKQLNTVEVEAKTTVSLGRDKSEVFCVNVFVNHSQTFF